MAWPWQMACELQACTEALMRNALFIAVFSKTPGGVQTKFFVCQQVLAEEYHHPTWLHALPWSMCC